MRRDGESGVTGLRICFFNRSYWPDLGATGQLLTELAEDLVRDYHCQVSVATGQPLLRVNAARSDAWLWWPVRREVHHGVQIFRAGGTTLRPHQFAARAANYVSYFLSTCLASLVVPRPQVVVALTDPPIIGLTAIFTARRFGAGFTFVCQDVFPQVARLVSDFQNETFNHVLDRINRLLIRQADRVEALGETMHAQLMAEKGADPHKLSVIHNWADCTAIVPKPQFNPFAQAHGLANQFVVMHSGNIGLSQGLESLVEAAAQLKEYADIQVVLIGEGVQKPMLEAQARTMGLRNVRFLPHQPKEEISSCAHAGIENIKDHNAAILQVVDNNAIHLAGLLECYLRQRRRIEGVIQRSDISL